MIRMIVVVTLVLASQAIHAQEQNACPEFQESAGIEFVFKTDDLYKKGGFPMFAEAPSGYTAMPYESLAGHKGKVVGAAPGTYGSGHYHRVLLDDCRTVYWYDTDEQLQPIDARMGGVAFIDKVSLWGVSESTDRMTDARKCIVTPKSDVPYPMFYYHSHEGFSVVVVGGDFPGRPVTFRVDKNKAISETEGLHGARAQSLAAQIRAGGKKLLVGFYEWPNDYEVVKQFNLSGLSEKLDECKARVRN